MTGTSSTRPGDGGGVVRLGVIGTGAEGSAYAQLLLDGRVRGAALGAVADLSPERRAAAAAWGVPVHEHADALLGSGHVDAVVVCVPHYLHPEVAVAALRAGLHVLVEKPAGVHTSQVAEMNEVAAAHPELVFAMMFNQRTNPVFRRVKEVIDAGEIGAVRRSTWTITTWWRPQGYYEQSPWRATWGGEGGGVLVNQAPHQLDLWQWICGVPRSVFAKVGYGFRRDIAVEDEVVALVDHGGGVTGTLVTAVHDLVGTDRLEVLGDRGKVVVEGSRTATITRYDDDERAISAGMGPEQVRDLFRGGFDPSSRYHQEVVEAAVEHWAQHVEVMEDFASSVLRGTPLIAPGSEGIRGVRLANAIHLSSWLGREVPLDFDEDEYLRELNARIRAEGRFPERRARLDG